MRNFNRLFSAFFLFFILFAVSAIASGQERTNFFEYSYGSYGTGDSESGWPMLMPPLIKIYSDGEVIFYVKSDNKFHIGNLAPKSFEQIKKWLSSQKYLRESRLVKMKGGMINEHGGVFYMRYLDDDDEKLLSTEVNPAGGTWMKIVNRIKDILPKATTIYYPDRIELSFNEDKSNLYRQSDFENWPFTDKVELASEPKEISYPEIIKSLFDQLENGFSFISWEFKENGRKYHLFLNKIPGFYQDDYQLCSSLSTLKMESKDKKGKQ